MKIFTKLILALMLTSLLILTIIFSVVQWSFDRGMLNYVNQKQLENLQLFSDNLSNYYQAKGNWQSLLMTSYLNNSNNLRPPPNHFPRPSKSRNDKHLKRKPADRQASDSKPPPQHSLWLTILRLSEQGESLPDDIDTYLDTYLGNASGNNSANSSYGPPRPRREKTRDFPPPRRGEHQPQKEPPTEFGHKGAKPALLDKNKALLIGHYRDDFSLKAIKLDKQIIGYLALPPARHLTDSFDLAFAKQMQQNLLYTFLVFFLLIILIALPLSRHFVLPIKRLERSMRLLNKGDFKVNLKVRGKDELASLSQNFNDLAQTLEQNEDSRKRWLANISHELRTPIAIIKSEIEAIEDGIRPLNLQSLQSLSEEVQHLQKLVSDLTELTNAEIGALRYKKERINVSELIIQNINRHQPKANEVGLSISCKVENQSLFIWADETRINQLLDNLLNNSIKYTQAPGAIFVNLTKKSGQVMITIDDTLPGVPNESLAKLFEHLYRVESSRNRKTGGSGLGLSLCKSIVLAHQGSITASESTSGGLRICCTLALA
ncbi:MAG: HAMP domain-containing protein [Colwellia sp.]|nr:HAMP domain-containing protein [Colwellia sp.]